MATWNVTPISQRTENMCWEACGRMLWQWRHGNLANYQMRAGPWAFLNSGLNHHQMEIYYRLLGIRSLRSPRGANLRHALRWTPAIFTSVHQASGHAMVVTGYERGHYIVVNPCGHLTVDFSSPSGTATCSSGTVRLPRRQVEDPLGPYMWYW